MAAVPGEDVLVGLTQKGIDIWFALRATFLELAIPSEETGELLFRMGPGGGAMMVRRMETIWMSLAGMDRWPIHEEILTDVLKRPKTVRDVGRRLVGKKAGGPSGVRLGVARLLEAGVLTDDPKEMRVVGEA